MSWYSIIYVRVREYSERNPIRGFFLTRLLNALLMAQLLGLVYSFYVYVYIVCGHFLQSPLQATIYLCVYSSLAFMALWSLFSALFVGVARIPQHWAVTPEVDAKLKECTPFENGRYVADKSTTEQTVKQHRILTKVAAQLGVVQAECDQAGRNKYCYICMRLKPDRAHHCSSCGKCVVKFDHHCPWINQCVNHANYKQFLLYIFYSTLTVVWFLLTSIECFVRFILNGNWLEDSIPLALLLIVMVSYGVFGYYPLGEMLIFHFGLISLNETTCEQAKPSVLKFDFKADYNLGKEKNFLQVFGWGLWLFPLRTTMEDGMHFEIRYVEPSNQMRFKRVIVSAVEDEVTGVGVDAMEKSLEYKDFKPYATAAFFILGVDYFDCCECHITKLNL
ncbi:DHHC zinc finger domain protein [Dictyocaulus viviparus]|uniref:Palmitoyltransferase n=1 Tax=Dictyocaulus viviparus TaxID=29172 RepID=A0A0D8Y450_DICVI|nr:DHHC zinc finger domain protein [Dictyocaulus viviparus]